MVECSVYFTIVTNGLQNSNDFCASSLWKITRR